MKNEEKAVNSYLHLTNQGIIRFEPDGNIPPDFSIDSRIAIEVRRLNQHLFNESAGKGLEQFAYPVWDAFIEVLQSFNTEFNNQTYFVGIEFQRSLNSKVKELKPKIRAVLEKFLNGERHVPLDIIVNDDITLSVHETISTSGVLFKPAGSSDTDSGGEVVQLYSENLKFCITEKTKKVRPYISRYQEWWLFLVDHLGVWILLDQCEIAQIERAITDIGCFQKVCILHADGKNILLTLRPNEAST